MKLTREMKRKTKEPHTRIPDTGLNKTLAKIDKAIKTLNNRR